MSDNYYGYVYPLTIFGNKGVLSHIETQGGYIPSLEQIESILEWCNRIKGIHKTQQSVDDANEGLCEDTKEQYRIGVTENTVSLFGNKKQNFNEDPCYIYIVKDIHRGLFKIGKANNIENRVKQLKTANAGIEIETWYYGAKKDEKILHSIFEDVRISGEWFCLNTENLEFIGKYFEQKSA